MRFEEFKFKLLMTLGGCFFSFFVPQSHSAYWLVDKATASQICDLARVIDTFTQQCEKISSKTSTALRSAFKVQVCEIFFVFTYCSAEYIFQLGSILFGVPCTTICSKCYCLSPCYVNPVL